MAEVKVIKINENIFAENEHQADIIRSMLSDKGIFFMNVMSSPGSGKTTLLCNVINRMKEKYHIFEMDVDIRSSLDAQRVSDATGVESLQIHNGGLCHIDSDMVSRALTQIDLKGIDILILENIGNLVCPAEFDTGAHKNVMILSVSEGDDKPLKYPLMFEVSDLIIISKIDTLDFFDFNIDRAKKYIHKLNPDAEVIALSAKTGEGVDELVAWIEKQCKKIL